MHLGRWCFYRVLSLGKKLVRSLFLHYKENWLDNCPTEFKPSFLRMYVNNIFVTFQPSESVYLFPEYIPSEHQFIGFTVEHDNSSSLLFLDVRTCLKNGKLSLMFTEIQHLLEFSAVVKLSFELTKRGDFYTHYFRGFSFGRHSIWKSIIWGLSPGKTITLQTLLIRVLSHFLITFIHTKLLLRMFINEMFC